MAGAAEVWITEAVWRYPGVQALLEPYPTDAHTTQFPGIDQPMTVVRVGSQGGAAAESGTRTAGGRPGDKMASEQ
jgi:hypothetical protein